MFRCLTPNDELMIFLDCLSHKFISFPWTVSFKINHKTELSKPCESYQSSTHLHSSFFFRNVPIVKWFLLVLKVHCRRSRTKYQIVWKYEDWLFHLTGNFGSSQIESIINWKVLLIKWQYLTMSNVLVFFQGLGKVCKEVASPN